ncbi:hypothetical protein [Streptomyces sp. AK010]|uniref:hypothetical protein n=1 Tax=Streptomyces sp. AK010 TaxID=2723074 RepID=UPI001609240B|nr:hypothetical protein [Streptomyces sp. AK010]MBB6421435.1 hypothetical protein [Streptomyces sp. AK010]
MDEDGLYKSIKDIVAGSPGDGFPAASLETLFHEAFSRRVTLLQHIFSWGADRYGEVERRSHETPTHFKWNLADLFVAEGRHVRVWLHQYRPPEDLRVRYAQVPHNHRYPFVSVVLNGGYRNDSYRPLRSPELPAGPPELLNSRTLRAGDTLAMRPTEVHRLADIQRETLTLLVQGSPATDHSFSYRESTGDWLTHRDLRAQYRTLRHIAIGTAR